MKNLELSKKQVRAVEVVPDFRSLDENNRTMEFSFSSETPYMRYYGFEIISHAKGAINLERLKSDAALLFNHDWNKQVGVIEDAWIGEDKRGYVRVRFGRSPFAEEKFQDSKDGILKSVSFGYMIDEMVLTKKSSGEDPDEYTVTKCTPFEVSLVTVPADFSVGVGKNAEGDEKITIRGLEPEPEPTPAPTNINDDLTASQKAAEERKFMDDIAKATAAAKQAEKERQASINVLGEKFGDADMARQLIEGDKSIDEARAAFIEKHAGKKQEPVKGTEADVGLTEKELNKFSFMKALNYLANPNDKRAREAAKFELEVAEAGIKQLAKLGIAKETRGLFVPTEILRATRRDLVAGTPSAGGNVVADNLLAGSFIEILRNKSVLQRAGIQSLNGLVGNIAIPRQTGAATAYWVAESGAPTESQQALDQVTMSPKTVGAFTDYSRKLMIQSSIDVENMVRGDLAAVLALEIDRAGLYGLGSSNEPEGLKLVSGINTEDFGAATPTFAEIVSMESKIAADNADVGSMKYIFNASMRGALKTAVKVSSYPVFLLEGGLVNGYSHEVSNQIASGDIFFGVWNQLILGLWSGLDLTVDPYTHSTSGTVRVVALQDVDFAVRHPEAFCRGNNTL
jgi:HK97 family phage major capsid protein/HK97 family phage prohead protease